MKREILALLRKRGPGKTICPSEMLPFEEKQNAKRMESVRKVAIRMANEGLIEITQRGRAIQQGRKIDPEKIRGPIRLKLIEDPHPRGKSSGRRKKSRRNPARAK